VVEAAAAVVVASMTGHAAAGVTATRDESGTTFAAHMFEVIIVTAVERTAVGLREGELHLTLRHLMTFRSLFRHLVG
jgi:hypothetical protein